MSKNDTIPDFFARLTVLFAQECGSKLCTAVRSFLAEVFRNFLCWSFCFFCWRFFYVFFCFDLAILPLQIIFISDNS